MKLKSYKKIPYSCHNNMKKIKFTFHGGGELVECGVFYSTDTRGFKKPKQVMRARIKNAIREIRALIATKDQ